MRPALLRLTFVAIVAAWGPLTVLARTYFVHPSGSDHNEGTDPNLPVGTLQRCVRLTPLNLSQALSADRLCVGVMCHEC